MRRREQGSAVAELVLTTPILIMFAMFALLCGRLADARIQTDAAARQAARTASISRTAGEAGAQARQAAQAVLADHRVTCQPMNVSVDLGGFRPGGFVRVSVACSVRLADLALLGIPGVHVIKSEGISGVDLWRSAR